MYEDRTAENIRAEMSADIQAITGASPIHGGFVDVMVGRTAIEHAKVYAALKAVMSMLFVDEASGGFLDLHGMAYHNMTRKEGTKAAAAMTFSGAAGTVIGAGTVFLSPDGLAFTLKEAVTIAGNGQGAGVVEAEQAGDAYNVAAGELSRMSINLLGLEHWHNDAAQGGSDEESDAAFYSRIDERRKRPPTSGNIYDYRQWALEVAGVGAVKVIPRLDGPGTVGILVVDSDMAPVGSATAEAVAVHIEDVRPIGATVTVGAPEPVSVQIGATVELAAGTAVESVAAAFTVAVGRYLKDLVERKYGAIYTAADQDTAYTVVYNRVAALLMDVSGVVNYTALTINGHDGDLQLSAAQVPVLGEVTLT